MRTGIGFDVHRFCEGRPLVLCGVLVQSDRGLLGHSDADAPVHALMDALLGAKGLKDIGTYFPDTDAEFAGANSMELLSRVLELIKPARVVNVDITIILEKPRLKPYIDEMKLCLASALGLDKEQVGVKATTTEGLGFTGREEGLAAIATCLIEEDK